MSLLDLYTKKVSEGKSTFGALGKKNEAPSVGVDFMDGQARGPWKAGSSTIADVWQKGFVPNSKAINPAGSNEGKYPDSKWTEASLKIAFDGSGPPTRPEGYLKDIRFNEFKDSAGRNGTLANGFTPTKLHNYAPLDGKRFGEVSTIAGDRIKAGATSTSVGGIKG
jgi:hypothetical protein